LPAAAQVGKTKVGGIELNKPRMRRVAEAVITLSASPGGFTVSELAARVRPPGKHSQPQYGPCRAAYDLKKLRGKQIVRRIGRARRYEPIPAGLRAITALVVLGNKAIKPLLGSRHNCRAAVGEIEVRPEPDRTSSPRGCRYRYYVSQALLHQRKEDAGSLPRLPAHDFEALISGRIVEVLGADARLKAALVKVGYAAHSNEEMSVNHDRRGRHAFFRRHPGFVAGCCAIAGITQAPAASAASTIKISS